MVMGYGDEINQPSTLSLLPDVEQTIHAGKRVGGIQERNAAAILVFPPTPHKRVSFPGYE
jgi:hypothetical protein